MFFPNLEELNLPGLGTFMLLKENLTIYLPKLTKLNLHANQNPQIVETSEKPHYRKRLRFNRQPFSSMNIEGSHSFETIDVSINKFKSLYIMDDPKTCESQNQLCVGWMRGLKKLQSMFCEIETFSIEYSSLDPVPNLSTLNLSATII